MAQTTSYLTDKIDTKISPETHSLLKAYMIKADRNKSAAIRILINKALATEEGLQEIIKKHNL